MSTNAKKILKKLNKGDLSFGDMLLTIRETDDITQADLAKKCRVSRGLICDIEKGRRLPTLEQVKIFAEKLGYPIQGFLAQVLEDQLKSANLKNYKVKVEAAS